MAYKPKDIKERKLHRLKIINGHLKKVISMVRNDDYCIDVLHQSRAIQSALKELDNIILEEHLSSCVVDHIKQGKTKTTIDEVMNVFKKQM